MGWQCQLVNNESSPAVSIIINRINSKLTSVSENKMGSVQEKATICTNSPAPRFSDIIQLENFPLGNFNKEKKVKAIEVAHLREDYEKLL